jgi:hypothetical protein
MAFEHKPEFFDTDSVLRPHGAFASMTIDVVQTPTYEESILSRYGWIATRAPHVVVVGELIDGHDTAGQAAAGIDGSARSSRTGLCAEWHARIPDDAPPELTLFVLIDNNSDGILRITCEPARDYLALAVLTRHRRLLIDSKRTGIDGVKVRYRLLIDPIPTEGLREVADYLRASADDQENLYWARWHPKQET